jgi:hypothetical protein
VHRVHFGPPIPSGQCQREKSQTSDQTDPSDYYHARPNEFEANPWPCLNTSAAPIRGEFRPTGGSPRSQPLRRSSKRRVEMIASWTAPDYARVNLSEEGSAEVMQSPLDAGVGIEAGIRSIEDVHRPAASGLRDSDPQNLRGTGRSAARRGTVDRRSHSKELDELGGSRSAAPTRGW